MTKTLSDRPSWRRLQLNHLTIGYHAFEAVGSVTAGVVAGSVAPKLNPTLSEASTSPLPATIHPRRVASGLES